MFGRLSFVQGDPGRLDDLITYVRTVVKPVTDQLEGNFGLGMWVNRTDGEALVMTVWQDEAALRASEQAVEKLRDDAAGIVGGSALVERYETVLVDAAEPHRNGYVLRLVRLQSDPSKMESNMAWARENVLPRVKAQPGFASYVVGIDRRTGAVATFATYRDASAAAEAAAVSDSLRAAAAARGTVVRDTKHYEVAIVGIRAPMPSVPQQQAAEVTERVRQG